MTMSIRAPRQFVRLSVHTTDHRMRFSPKGVASALAPHRGQVPDPPFGDGLVKAVSVQA